VHKETFLVGDRVQKIRGYRWPGIVVAAFETLDHEPRYVVECTTEDVRGALHIYAPEQIAKVG
jgi:hypothetical protein